MARPVTIERIPGKYALSVGLTDKPAPSGWKWTILSDVARLESGHTPSRSRPDYWDGDIPWIGIRDAKEHHGQFILDTHQAVTPLGIENSAARILPAQTVCLSRTASVGYCFILGREMATSQDFVNWVCSPAIEPRFLMHCFLAEGSDGLRKFGKGSTHTTIYFPEVQAFHVCLPPLNEQRRIVARIEDLTARSKSAKEALQAIPPLLEKFRQSVLAAAFRGDLTAEWRRQNPDVESAEVLLERIRVERRKRWEESGARGKYVEPEPVDASGLPELPRGWCWATIQTVSNVVSGFAFESRDFVTQGIPVIKISNIGYGRLVDKNQQFLPPSFCAQYPGFLVTRRTPLLALTRPITDGQMKACVYPHETPGLLNQRVAAFTNVDYSVTLLLFWMQTQAFRHFVESKLPQTLQPNLSPKDLQQFPIPVPPSLEQEALAGALQDAVDACYIFRTYEVAGEQLSSLDQSILSKAFRGELVPQDPNDEPASSLLQRIRTQKLDQAPKTRRKTLVGGDR